MIEDYVVDILKTLPPRISDVVKPWADQVPNRPAIVEVDGTWTYGQLASVMAQTKTWLLDCGVRPGDRVMIVCENCRTFVAVLLALADIGAWPVLVNARLSGPEVDQIRDHCQARLVIYTTGASSLAAAHAKRHSATVREMGSLGLIGIGRLNEKVEREETNRAGENNVAVLIYTSGTTSVPKGVMLTHQNLLFVAAVSARIRSLSSDDRLYGVLPMSHIVGLSVVLLGTLLSGATLYLAPRFDPVSALVALEKDGLTIMLGVPAMFALLVEYAKSKGLERLKLPALRIISSVGAPLCSSTKFAVESLFGLVLHNGYGATECSPTIAQTRVEAPRTDTSVGPAFPGTAVKLVGTDGKTVPAGQVGELWVRGPHVMKGYYRAPEATAAALDAEGWFNTRDLARLEDGNIFIVGRSKDLIVRFGFNVYPAEIETVLNAHPAVVRSGVIGQQVSGVEGNEEVMAFVQVCPGSSVTTAELAEHARRHLARYKQPSQIVLIPEMPMTPTGKIRKDELEKMLHIQS